MRESWNLDLSLAACWNTCGRKTYENGTEDSTILVHFNQSVTLSTLSISSTTPPSAEVANVDDFSEIIYERQSDRNWASGFLYSRLAAAVF